MPRQRMVWSVRRTLLSDRQFWVRYSMSKSSFGTLSALIAPLLATARAVDPDVQLSIALRALKGAKMCDVEDIHGVGGSTAHLCFDRVLHALDAALPLYLDLSLPPMLAPPHAL